MNASSVDPAPALEGELLLRSESRMVSAFAAREGELLLNCGWRDGVSYAEFVDDTLRAIRSR